MIEGKKVLAIIPARGGSKGIPKKNIHPLGGKPLIAWTIDEAKKSKYIDRLILSSDDEEIISVAKKYNCEVPFVRPAELSLDTTSGMDPVMHAVEMVPGYDLIVLLQPTSPLRLAEDIDGTIECLLKNKSKACLTLSESEQSPFWMYTLSEKNELKPLIQGEQKYVRRQDLPSVYTINGAVYVAYTEWLQSTRNFLTEETHGYIMPSERAIDIDTPLDLKIAELLIQNSAKDT